MRRKVLDFLSFLCLTLFFGWAYSFSIQEHRIHLGSKWIFHVEAFLARIMSVYKQYLLAGLEDSMFDLDEIDLQ